MYVTRLLTPADKNFKTKNSIHRHKKLFVARLTTGRAFGKGGGEKKDSSVKLQEEVRLSLPSHLKIYYLVFKYKINVYFLCCMLGL